MGFPDGFVLGRRDVYGTGFSRVLSQSMRMGHVNAMITKPLETANLPHPKWAVLMCPCAAGVTLNES